jgi:hypothetical protein
MWREGSGRGEVRVERVAAREEVKSGGEAMGGSLGGVGDEEEGVTAWVRIKELRG